MDMFGTVLVGVIAGVVVATAVLGLDAVLRGAEHAAEAAGRDHDHDGDDG